MTSVLPLDPDLALYSYSTSSHTRSVTWYVGLRHVPSINRQFYNFANIKFCQFFDMTPNIMLAKFFRYGAGFSSVVSIHLGMDYCPLYRVAGCLLFRGF